MRRNFAEVLRNGKIDINEEYTKLYQLFYFPYRDGSTLFNLISNSFLNFSFRGTCLSFEEFNRKHGFVFVPHPHDFDVNHLVSFCEYVYNLVWHLNFNNFPTDQNYYTSYIEKVIDDIGYMRSVEDGFYIFVPKDSVAISVSESPLIPEDISYKVIAYNHHSRQGDLEAKKDIIRKLAELLEPKRKTIERLNKDLKHNLFDLFNNFNIRHNNIDPTDLDHYNEYIAKMPKGELEDWYDETYQMCLLAFMELEYENKKGGIKDKLEKLRNQFRHKC